MVDEASDHDAFGLVQGENAREWWTSPKSMGAWWLTLPGHVEPGMGRRTARNPPNGRVHGASGKETRREGGRGDPEARAA